MLIAVESLTLGEPRVSPTENADRRLSKLMIRQSFEHSPTEREVAQTTIRAIASGIRGVVYRTAACGRDRGAAGPGRSDWSSGHSSYQQARRRGGAPWPPQPPLNRAPSPTPGRVPDDLDWKEPPDSPRSRAALTQRERIVRAVGQLVAENGYETLSIPAISATGGNLEPDLLRTFRQQTRGIPRGLRRQRLRGPGRRPPRPSRPPATAPRRSGRRSGRMLEHIAANELFARPRLLRPATAGPDRPRPRRRGDGQTSPPSCGPGVASKGIDRPAPEAVLQAVGMRGLVGDPA